MDDCLREAAPWKEYLEKVFWFLGKAGVHGALFHLCIALILEGIWATHSTPATDILDGAVPPHRTAASMAGFWAAACSPQEHLDILTTDTSSAHSPDLPGVQCPSSWSQPAWGVWPPPVSQPPGTSIIWRSNSGKTISLSVTRRSVHLFLHCQSASAESAASAPSRPPPLLPGPPSRIHKGSEDYINGTRSYDCESDNWDNNLKSLRPDILKRKSSSFL